MEKTPLHLRLRRESHRRIARLQDLLVEALYRVFPRAVLHGGAAIWRCYSGNRFSEDVDVYLSRDPRKVDRLFEELERMGFSVLKKRTTAASLYSSLTMENTEVRLEALFRSSKGVVREYETCEGILLNVFTLEPEEMVKEKVEAYLKQRKVRDLYDVFFMLRYCRREAVRPHLSKLLERFRKPEDEGELRALILFGAIPTADDLLEYIRRAAE